MEVNLNYTPQAKQMLLHNAVAKQIFYGGAAGGGKSHSLRWDAVMFCLRNPGMEAYLFRRTYSELEDNHIRPIIRELPMEIGQYLPSKNIYQFKNGSRIVFCHCEHTNDYLKYMGAEFHWLGLDEASLMEPIQIIELRARVRLGGFSEKIVDKEFLPRIIMTSNPGGPSHNLLKRTFIDAAPPMNYFHDKTLRDPRKPDDKGWLSIFIPARMEDNVFLDESYGSVFGAMAPERARALREGDWDAVEGAALHNLSKSVHGVKPFTIPTHWTRFMSMDWGTAKPFSVGWYCVAGENTWIKNNDHIPETKENPDRRVFIPHGSIIRYNEWYGWDGQKEDVGIRLDSVTVAQGIIEREKEMNLKEIDYRVCDSAMYAQHDGPSPAERMMYTTGGRIVLRKVPKDRTANYNEILSRLNPVRHEIETENGTKRIKAPTLFITTNCSQAWRTLPPLLLDSNNPDKGPGEKQEDHVYDELAYACASRPVLNTIESRVDDEMFEYEKAIKRTIDPYSTV